MAVSSTLRIIKPKNNNLKRKRLIIHSTREDIINMKAVEYRKKDRRFRSNLFAILIISLAIMASMLFNSKKNLTNIKNEYNNLESQYVSYELTRDRLKTKLESSIDLKEIQRYAMEELNMVYANDDNTVYVNVNR